MVQERFPNTPILSTFGNNDVIRNYQAPGFPDDGVTREDYYREMYKIWFEEVPANNQ